MSDASDAVPDAPDRRPRFSATHESAPSGGVIAGFSAYGLAGLTAADYPVDQLDLTERGHVTASGIPAITPFEDGRPRRNRTPETTCVHNRVQLAR